MEIDKKIETFVKINKMMMISGFVQILFGIVWFGVYADKTDPDRVPLAFMGSLGGFLIIFFGLVFVVLSRITVKNISLFQNAVLILSVINIVILIYGWPCAIVGFIVYYRLDKYLALDRASITASNLPAQEVPVPVEQSQAPISAQGLSAQNTSSTFFTKNLRVLSVLSKISLILAMFILAFQLRYVVNFIFLLNFSPINKAELMQQFFTKFFVSSDFLIILVLSFIYLFVSFKARKEINEDNISQNITPQASETLNKRLFVWGIVSLVLGFILLTGFYQYMLGVINYYRSYRELGGVGYYVFVFMGILLLVSIFPVYLGAKMLFMKGKSNLYILKRKDSMFTLGILGIFAGVLPGIGALLVSESIGRLKKEG